jgi:hypothetical protein
LAAAFIPLLTGSRLLRLMINHEEVISSEATTETNPKSGAQRSELRKRKERSFSILYFLYHNRISQKIQKFAKINFFYKISEFSPYR